MNWLDVAGPPGSGKSTLCDPLWGPHALPIEDRLPPAAWHDFLNEITRLFHLIKPHPTYPAALRMVNRSVRKMATVARMPSVVPATVIRGWESCGPVSKETVACDPAKPYIQTGLVQRGLGFGWRLNHMGKDLAEIKHYFRLMPVSLGVAVTRCPQEIVEQRNHVRRTVAATAHEDRAHMVGLMQPAIEVAVEVLRERGVEVLEVDTSGPVDKARAQLIEFAAKQHQSLPRDYRYKVAGHTQTMGPCDQDPVLSPPPWWQ
jgi:hypothetical protein